MTDLKRKVLTEEACLSCLDANLRDDHDKLFDHPVAGEADEKAQIASNPSYQICEGGGHGLLLPANNGKDEIFLFSIAPSITRFEYCCSKHG